MIQEEKNDNQTKVVDDISNQENNITTVPSEKNYIKKTILTLTTLAVVAGVGFFVYSSKIKSNEPLEQFEPIDIDYTKIINNWNKQVQNNTSKKEFLLNRESNDEMIKQLNNWMKIFYIPEVTRSWKYNEFMEKNKFGKLIEFNTSMNTDKIRELLKKATKEKIMSKIVKKVLMMNDMELWKQLKSNE